MNCVQCVQDKCVPKCCEISLTLLHRDAWHKLGDKSKRDCMLEYINRLLEIDADWEEKVF